MQKLSVVVNLRAGGARGAGHWPGIKKLLRDRLGPYEAYICQDYASGYQAASAALQAGADRLLCIGGDGTLNDVFNALMRTARRPAEIPVGILPNGSGCDLARTLSIPRDVGRALDVVAAGRLRQIDLGLMRSSDKRAGSVQRYFHNVLSFGLGGLVVQQINRESKLFGPRLAFMLAALRAIVRYRPQAVEVRLDQGPALRSKVWNVAIANGRFHGGGMLVAPQARVDDGLLDVLVIGDISRRGILLHLPKLYNGRIARAPKVTQARAGRVQARGSSFMGLDVDGENLGCLPLDVVIAPRAVSLYAKG